MAQVIGGELQIARFISDTPGGGILAAIDGAGVAQNLIAWSTVTGDVTYSAPAGTGANTRLHQFSNSIVISKATGSAVIDPALLRLRSTTNAADWITTAPWAAIEFWSDDLSGIGAAVRARIGARFEGAAGITTGIVFSTSDSTALATRWRINSAGHMLAETDNVYDFGAAGATRARTVYAATSVITPLVVLTTGVQLNNATASITGVNTRHVELLNNRTAPVDNTYANNSNSFLYITGSAGPAEPFNAAGHLVFQNRVATGFNRGFYWIARDPAAVVMKLASAGQIDLFSGGADIPTLTGNRAATSVDAPTAVGSGSALLRIQSAGHDGTSYVNGARIDFAAAEAWGATARGSRIEFWVVLNTTTAAYQPWQIANTGHILPLTDNAYDLGSTSFRPRSLYAGTSLLVGGSKVVGTRVTGYTNAMTGAANRATAYDVATVTLAQLAGRVKALQDDLTTHGLIGV